MAQNLIALAERVEACKRTSNPLDVLVEIALFEPDKAFTAIRANAAGTKVIFDGTDGRKHTHWAQEWTAHPKRTAAALRARALLQEPTDDR